jgi:hypothetical protein
LTDTWTSRSFKEIWRLEIFGPPIADSFVHSLNTTERMACISARIPMDFNVPVRTVQAQDLETKPVEKHMQVCLDVNMDFKTATTVALSEPLLTKA